MTAMEASAAPLRVLGPSDIRGRTASFRRSLLAENKADRTVQSYMEGVQQFIDHLIERGMPTVVESLAREHVESFVAELLGRWLFIQTGLTADGDQGTGT
jgi:hypothetical protein